MINGDEAEEGAKQRGKSLQRETGQERTDGSRRAASAEMLILVQTPAILFLHFQFICYKNVAIVCVWEAAGNTLNGKFSRIIQMENESLLCC